MDIVAKRFESKMNHELQKMTLMISGSAMEEEALGKRRGGASDQILVMLDNKVEKQEFEQELIKKSNKFEIEMLLK